MRLAWAVVILLSALPSWAQSPPRPSFDCGKAVSPDEKAICADPRLAELDQAASMAFSQIPGSSRDSARAGARDSLAARRRCGADRLCILDQQVNALLLYDAEGAQIPVPPWVGQYRVALFDRSDSRPTKSLPTQIAQCTKTKISAISARLGGPLKPPSSPDDDPGFEVQFLDQGGQVSYSYDAAVGESAIGDPVLVCLVSIPQDCPKGDDRGKVYSTTNLRTLGSWMAPDAEHMCGGA